MIWSVYVKNLTLRNNNELINSQSNIYVYFCTLHNIKLEYIKIVINISDPMQVEKVQIYIYSFHTLLPLELHNASKSSVNNMSVTTMICYQLFVVWNSAFHKIGKKLRCVRSATMANSLHCFVACSLAFILIPHPHYTKHKMQKRHETNWILKRLFKHCSTNKVATQNTWHTISLYLGCHLCLRSSKNCFHNGSILFSSVALKCQLLLFKRISHND